MSEIRLTIEAIALTRGRFKVKHILRQVRVSRQAIWKHLRSMVDSGELVRQGAGPGSHYARGPGFGAVPDGAARTSDHEGFWAELMSRCPKGAYIELYTIVGTAATQRAQATRVLEGLVGRDLIVADFRGLRRATEQFVDELLCKWPTEWCARVEPINVPSAIQPIIERVLRLRKARVGRPDILWGSGRYSRE
jgi:hypothetical protein